MVQRLLQLLKPIGLRLFPLLPPGGILQSLILYLVNWKFIVGVLACIRDERGRIMLVRHTYRGGSPLGLPGGAVKDESVRKALARELMEETSLEIEVGPLIGVEHSHALMIDLIFDCSIRDGTFQPSDEVSDYGYFEVSDLPPGLDQRHRQIILGLEGKGLLSQSGPGYGFLDMIE